jgi:hypothetical protein
VNFAELVDAARVEIASPTPSPPHVLLDPGAAWREIGHDLERRADLMPVTLDLLLHLGRFALAVSAGWTLSLVDNVLVFLRDDRRLLLPHTTPEQALITVVAWLFDDPEAMAELPAGTLPVFAAMVRHARAHVASGHPIPSSLAALAVLPG